MNSAHGDGSDGSERRASGRHLACFAANIEGEDSAPRMALIRDLSATGALLFTQSLLKTGEALILTLYVTGELEKPHATTARVVRSGRRRLDRANVWPYDAAVRFDEPLKGLDAEIEKLAALQASLWSEWPQGG